MGPLIFGEALFDDRHTHGGGGCALTRGMDVIERGVSPGRQKGEGSCWWLNRRLRRGWCV